MRRDRRLAPYRARRDPDRSPEPRGDARESGRTARFVVQKHEASTLHYDFRLEVEGVLKSWAVPKGPSTAPKDKRLALPTEDHPLDYIDFEGVIPEGQYGGGAVLVWDTGTYDNITDKDGRPVPMTKALEDGHALFRLHGQKLEGGFALQRTGAGGKARWLLIKMRGEGADARRKPLKTQPRSVLSERTIEQVADEEPAPEAASGAVPEESR